MAAAVPLDAHDFALANARFCWNRSRHLRHANASACREARQLSLQISAQLQAQVFNFPADLRSLARSLHIPLPSFRHLLALADPAAAPPTCTLNGCDFSLRLDPPDWALARRSLELLSRPGAPPFDISRSIADAFTSQTSGSLRDRLRQLHRAHPLDFHPQRVAALPPVSVPATPSMREPPPLPAFDQSLIESWRRLQTLRRSRRAANSELAELHSRLARLIFAQWQLLARSGRSSLFTTWLLMAGIPRSSAYRLLRQYHPHEGNFAPIPPPAQDLNCPENVPVAVLHQGKLLVRLSPQHATIVHAALTGLLAHPFNPAPIVVSHLASCIPLPDRASLDSLYRSPPPRFLPPLRLYSPVLTVP